MIIDAHTHLPLLDTPHSGEDQKTAYLRPLADDGVQRAVLIPDNVTGSVIGDLDTCIALFADNSKVSILGAVDLEHDPENTLRHLQQLLADRTIVGMKIFPGHDPIYPTDPRLDDVYAVCSRYGAPVVIHTGRNTGHPEVARYNDPKHIVQVSARHPSLPIVIAHYFWPEVEYCYRVSRGYLNIYFDTSGLADADVIKATGRERIRDVLTKTISDDPDRVIFGSDYGSCDRRSHIELVDSLAISAAAKTKVFTENAARLFRLP